MRVKELRQLLETIADDTIVMLESSNRDYEPHHITQLDHVSNVLFLRDFTVRMGQRETFKSYDGKEYIVPVRGERTF